MFLVGILLPLRDERGEPFPAEFYDRLARRLTESFGGVTSFARSPGEGRWKNRGATGHDEIVVIEVMAKETGSASQERVPGRGRLCIQDSTSEANHATRQGPMRRRAGKRSRAKYL
jgi:hypothetical protein